MDARKQPPTVLECCGALARVSRQLTEKDSPDYTRLCLSARWKCFATCLPLIILLIGRCLRTGVLGELGGQPAEAQGGLKQIESKDQPQCGGKFRACFGIITLHQYGILILWKIKMTGKGTSVGYGRFAARSKRGKVPGAVCSRQRRRRRRLRTQSPTALIVILILISASLHLLQTIFF
jgi:hypothetical protein